MVANHRFIVATSLMLALPWIAGAAETAPSRKTPGFPTGFSWQFTVREAIGEGPREAILLGEEDEVTPRPGAALPLSVSRPGRDGMTPPQDSPDERTIRLSTRLPLYDDSRLHGGIGIANELRRLDLRETAVMARVALRL